MRKQVISNDEARVNIVILSNESLDIIAKGVSKCHADDEYNKELGISIANTRAWIKYYEKLGAVAKRNLPWAEEMKEWYTAKVDKYNQMQELADAKVKEITAEYEKMIEGI